MGRVRLETTISNSHLLKEKVSKDNSDVKFMGTNTQFAPYNAANLKAYNLPIQKFSFGRRLSEHKSWGANVETKPFSNKEQVRFKLWAPKADRVFVETRESSKEILNQDDGFISVVSDGEGKFQNIISSDEKSSVIELAKTKDGIFEGFSQDAANGHDYRFILVDKEGNIKGLKDPYAKKQKHIFSWSSIYDHNKFEWSDKKWQKKTNDKRIGRYNPNLLPTISEIHVGINDLKGDFTGVKKKIDEYSKKGTFNTIELMPVEGCYFDPKEGIGFNWGYDGVDKMAPTELYGGPDKLKELVDYAHKKGINVIMDMVPNHIGPHGNYLNEFAPYVGGGTQWGDGFNYENANIKERALTRDYMTNVALNWLLDYHCDGLRLDMTQRMGSDFAMKQVELECRYHAPNAFITAEDARPNAGDGKKLNDARVIRRTREDDFTLELDLDENVREKLHESFVKKLDNNETSLENLDYDSQWDFAFHHSLASMLLGQEFMGYQPNLSSFEFSLKNGPLNTKYLMSHDEVGNNDGTRFISKVLTAKLGLYHRTNGSSPAEKGQRAANAAQKLWEAYQAGDESIWKFSKQKELHLNSSVSKEEFISILQEAKALDKLGMGTVFMAPGPKMIFDGAEKGVVSRFKFFAKHPDEGISQSISQEKGYDTGKKAFDDAVLERTDYKNYDEKTERFSDDLFKLLNSSKALQSRKNDNEHLETFLYNTANVMHVIRKEGDEQILAVMNFNNKGYDNFTLRNLPKGEWQEVINSNNEKYGGNGEFINNKSSLKTQNQACMDVKLPGNSIIILKKKS